MNTCILGIESSCDDTAAAIIKDGRLLSNITHVQVDHSKYGGVVPESASRQHDRNIVPVVDEAIQQAGISKSDISAVAFTRGPGLIGSLLVGVGFAKAFALALGIPIIEVNHLQAHILAHFIEEPHPGFPFLCLTVSGGHTQLVRVDSHLDMTVLGQTLDDAAGEAYDKTGKMLGLPYPAGPEIDRLAKEGNPESFHFPEPRIKGLDFSFSGLKTAVLYFLNDRTAENPDFIKTNLADLCASIQQRINTILIAKLRRAVRETGISEVALAGGVSANSGLRAIAQHYAEKDGWQLHIPHPPYTTDNAAMIAITGYYKFLAGKFADQNITPLARYPI